MTPRDEPDLARSVTVPVETASPHERALGPNPLSMNGSRAHLAVGSLLLALAFVLPASFMVDKSVTYDEVSELPAGYSYWKTGSISLNLMHPPLVKLLCSAPLLLWNPPLGADREEIRRLSNDPRGHLVFGARFFESLPYRDRALLAARLVAVAISALLAALVWVWSTKLWGPNGGLFSLALYVFDPTITSHAQLVKNDVGGALFGLLFLYSLCAYAVRPTRRTLLRCSVTLALALGAKFTNVVLIPIALGTLLPLWVGRSSSSSRLVRDLTILVATTSAALWGLYFLSPDPLFYLRGLEQIGGDHVARPSHFFLGQVREGLNPGYLVTAVLIKSPLPTILSCLAALSWLVMRRTTGSTETRTLLLAGLAYLLALSLATPVGVRHAIAFLPLLFVLAGVVGRELASSRLLARASGAALITWIVVEFASIAPDHLSYFNQLAGGYRGGLRWMNDSNVDWGQGLIALSRHLDAAGIREYRLVAFTSVDPALYGLHGQKMDWASLELRPAPGVLVISGHYLALVQAGLKANYGDGPGNWLRGLEPAVIVGHALYVYEVP